MKKNKIYFKNQHNMKPLKNLSLFSGELPLWKSSGNYRCYYRKNNSVSRMEPVSIDRYAIREPFFCIGVCEAGMLENSHLRSENSSMLSVERIVSGSLFCRMGDRGYLAEAGDVVLFLPEESFEFRTGPDGFCRKFSLVLEGPMLREALRLYGLEKTDILSGLDLLEMDRLIGAFRENIRYTGTENHRRNARLSLELFQFLSYREENRKIPPVLMHLVRDFELHPEHPFSLPEMAERCGCSVNHLLRLFQKFFGCTPHRKLIECRMKRAAGLLFRPELSIKEVAALSGCSDALNFSTGFRKFFGVSPKEYRKRGFFP